MLSFLPTPLHAALVHMPIALTVLVPVFAIAALWTIHRGGRTMRSWAVAVAMIAALLLSGWAALQTGQNDGERVEKVVGAQAVETHEEAAEFFLVATGIVLVLATAGFLRAKAGSVMRGVATMGTFALVGAGYNVGHSGGQLVYRDGAATAYTGSAGSNTPAAGRRDSVRRTGEEGERRTTKPR